MSLAGIVTFQKFTLSKTYKNTRAVKNLNFIVNKKECFGILGPNGAGKTTLMSMLSGKTKRDNPKNSEIDVFGYDPIDEIIITTALELEERHIKIFGLLYNCHTIDDAVGRIKKKGYKPLKRLSALRYKSDAKKRIVELIIKEEELMKKVKKALGADNE